MKIQNLSLLPLLALGHAATTPKVQDSKKGITYLGTSQNGVESFLNIPYGEDVDGSKRFTRPVAKQLKSGSTVDARKIGPACPQQKVPIPGFPFFSNVTNVAENCLNLRVDRAANTSASSKLPVMVFVYGGGLSIGQAYDKIYTPTGLLTGAASKKTPVVYVAMNYRLKIFGFAASDALSQEGNTNVGLLDQELALQWVQDNIEAFGGDPDNVTLFGQSDGATSVGLQYVAYGGQRNTSLFKRVIMESGTAVSDTQVNTNTSSVATLAVAKALKCPATSSSAALSCLRAAPFADLLNATLTYEKATNPPFGFGTFKAYVDGTFIPSAPSQLIRQGRFASNVSAILGWTLDDSSLFTDPSIANETGVASSISERGLGQRAVSKTLALYPASSFNASDGAAASYYRASRIGRDIEAACPSLFTARAISAKGAPVYLYQLDQTPLSGFYASIDSPFYGVSHFSDVFYVFAETDDFGPDIGMTPSDTALAGRMSGSWAAFAHGVAPGTVAGKRAGTSLGRWPTAIGSDGSVRVFAIGGDMEGSVVLSNATTHEGLDGMLDKCAFLTRQEIYNQLQT